MKTRRHMSANIEGMLANFKRKKMDGLFQDESGRYMSDKEARQFLAESKAKGWKLIPGGDCEGFDHFGGGCPGHPVAEETINLIGNRMTVGYRVHENAIILYWAKSENMIPFPYEMEVKEVTQFVGGWLAKTKPNYPQPDHDGDNEQGFRIYNEGWGHVGGQWEAFIAITPIWAMYGK